MRCGREALELEKWTFVSTFPSFFFLFIQNLAEKISLFHFCNFSLFWITLGLNQPIRLFELYHGHFCPKSVQTWSQIKIWVIFHLHKLYTTSYGLWLCRKGVAKWPSLTPKIFKFLARWFLKILIFSSIWAICISNES